jgi:uncharacterized protein with von Willebrand factor type A (vWA) domain
VNGGLLEREIGFFHALRDAGVGISLAEVLDATRALGVLDLMEREALREGLASCVLKRPAHRQTFDTLFDLWFPAVLGDPSSWQDDAEGEAQPGADGESEPADPAVMREMLKNLLLDGDDDAMRRFVRKVVSDLGRSDTAPGRQSWFSYRVLRSLSPETLMASLLEALLAGQERGGLAEKVARQTITERIKQFQEMVEAEVRRRLARTAASSRSAGPPCSRWPSRSTSCGPAATTWPSCAARCSRWPGGWPPG